MVLQPSTSASNNLSPRLALPRRGSFRGMCRGEFERFFVPRFACVQSVRGIRQRPALARISATGLARQSLETPQGDKAGLAAPLAHEIFVTEHEAPTLERKGGGGPPAVRTDQREISCAPAHGEMS